MKGVKLFDENDAYAYADNSGGLRVRIFFRNFVSVLKIMVRKELLRHCYCVLCATVALIVASGAVLQFHHHDEDSTICFSLHFHGSGGHANDAGGNHGDDGDCTMHLDKFLSGKHHFCFDLHCALCSKPVAVAIYEAGCRPAKAPSTIFVPLLPDISCPGLRAPPAMS